MICKLKLMTKFIKKEKYQNQLFFITQSKLFFFIQLSFPRFTKLLPIVHELFMVGFYRQRVS